MTPRDDAVAKYVSTIRNGLNDEGMGGLADGDPVLHARLEANRGPGFARLAGLGQRQDHIALADLGSDTRVGGNACCPQLVRPVDPQELGVSTGHAQHVGLAVGAHEVVPVGDASLERLDF